MNYFIADTHFGHKNIITYENRPFANIEEMDVYMIRKWNEVIKSNDQKVYVLGDFSFYDKEGTAKILSQLNGYKILILGNHDQHSVKWYLEAGFNEVYKHTIIVDEWFVCQHRPPEYYNDACPYFYLYGHVHSTELYPTITKQSCCVSVERWDYTPISMERVTREVIALLEG